MKYNKWYDKNISTSMLGFGCMRFKTNKGIVDEEKAIELIEKAYNNGINYFDTAVPYLGGQSEVVLGKGLKKYKRDSFYIASKYSLWDLVDPNEIYHSIDKQLSSLQTSYIDFYLLHALNKERLEIVKERGILDIVKKWKEEGKIKHIGFSFHDNYEVFSEILNLYDFEFCQIQFNYMDKSLQQGLKGYQDLVDRKIPIIVMEPLKGGKLASFNSEIAKIYHEYNNDSLVKWAFRWVSSQKGVMTVLSGMNEMKQLDENLEIYNNFEKLNEVEEKIVDKVSESLRNVEAVGCTGCEYCLPCPKGVNIPRNLRILNDYAMYENKDSVSYQYYLLNENKASADNCINCKVCLKKCPQHIDIPSFLNQVKELAK